MSRPIYIFDLDNTLAMTAHRQHFRDEKADPDRFKKYYAACVDDEPNEFVIETMDALRSTGADVWIWTGRSDEVRKQTLTWLQAFTSFTESTADAVLTMRRAGDMTPDYILKRQWLEALSPNDIDRLIAAFDDRDRVVNMYRESGLVCFQVAPGDY